MSLADLNKALHDIRIIRYSELASSVIILYDHILTLDDEFELIWNSSLSLGKCLFLVNRYYALVSVVFNNYALFSPYITDSLCLHWFRWQGWTGVVTFVLAELILQVRLYALYIFSKRVLVIMVTTCVVAAATSAAVMGSVLSRISASSDAIPGTKFCVPMGISHHFWAFWVPMLVSESVFCGLALYRGLENYHEGTLLRNGWRLVEILIRDSLFYFVIIFATYLANAVIFIVGSASEVEIPIGFAVALSCVLGNRLCLNVRGMIRRDDGDITNASFSTPEHIDVVPAAYHRSATLDLWDRSELEQIELTELHTTRAEPA